MAETLKPWFATPHEDIREGRLEEAVFAANIWAVVQKTAPEVYVDPEEFYRKTYMTVGLGTVLKRVASALRGDRLVFASTVLPGERIVKGTRLAAETLVAELEQGRSDQEMLQSHPELTREDVAALRHYARTPVGLRRSFGGWAEDAEELDKHLEWTRQQRKLRRTDHDYED